MTTNHGVTRLALYQCAFDVK